MDDLVISFAEQAVIDELKTCDMVHNVAII